MAKPVAFELPARDPREELRSGCRVRRLNTQRHARGYEVLQGLHDQGVLELLRGLLGPATR